MSTVEAWGEAGLKYDIHEETLDYFRILEGRKDRPIIELTPPDAREAGLITAKLFGGEVEFDGQIKEFRVPSPADQDSIPVSVYRTTKCPPEAPVVVYFHGGGFVVGSRATVDSICRSLARDTPCTVVSVEYRLAPENKLPACLDDAVCVTRWVKMNRALIGANNISALGTAGDSVGGHIASTVCHEVPDVDFQVLVYPMVDLENTYPSVAEFANTPGLNKNALEWFENHALTSPAQLSNPRITPLLRKQFSGLPPALVLLAELDPLRDCGYAYRDRISEAGVQTKLVLVKGAPHAFFRMPGHFKLLCASAYATVSEFIRKHGSNKDAPADE
ncbi:ethyl acetate hydrolase-like [Haliotis cracherodii]|uniref:ethyl acetate hydrolase-like n=1 Tax=Haliotis cracherodii TaxID=6455 RepID=UPI0039E79697